MQVNLDQMVAHLQKLRTQHGDENYHAALKSLFHDLILKDGGKQYIEALLERLGDPGIDVGALEPAEPPGAPAVPPSPEQEASASVIEQAIRQGMPNCKTKAQFNLTMRASEALRIYLNAAFGFDRETALKARDGLNTLLDLAPRQAEVTEKLEEHPDATTNRDYLEPPPDPAYEEAQQKSLLASVAALKSLDELTAWYASRKSTLDSILEQKLRNELFDAIRAKKASLCSSN